MNVHDIPHGYSQIHNGNALGNRIDYTVRADVNGRNVQATASHHGVSLRVEECQFKVVAEFVGGTGLNSGLYTPQRWTIGFVQNLTHGAIVYHYRNANAQLVTLAQIAPQHLPCKDAGGPSTWYDPNPALSRKQFGIQEQFANMFPAELNNVLHPAHTNNNVRYIEMGDAPGTGHQPLRLTCRRVDTNNRAQLGQQYRLSWYDPLDTNPNAFLRARLKAITGNLNFTTWLVVSSEPNPQNLDQTQLFIFLYRWEWSVDYTTTITGNLAIPQGGAAVVHEGPTPAVQNAVLVGQDANASVCVKFA